MIKSKANAEKIAFFLDICKDRRLSQLTRNSYDTALTEFYAYLEDQDKLVEEVGIFDIRQYKTQYLGKFAPSSQNLKLSVLRQFYDTLAEYKVLDNNPVVKSFNNRLEKKTLSFVPSADYVQIEDYFKEFSSDTYLLGLRLMYFSGLRVGEVGKVDLIYDVIYKDDKAFLKVHGKGAKERIVPVFSLAAERQIKEMASNHSSLIPLKIGSFQQNFQYHLSKASKVLNIPSYSCHDFRRGFAVNLYSDTKDLELLRVLLGHESFNTSLMYMRNVTVRVYDLPSSLFA